MKKGKIIALSVLAAAALLVILFLVVASINVKAMDRSVDAALAALEDHHTVTPVSPGEYEDLTLYGVMKFNVRQYEVEDVGNLLIMTTNLGVMQMSTFVISPYDRDLPLLSTDYMYMLGSRVAYLEYYNLYAQENEGSAALLSAIREVNEEYAYLPDREVDPSWYASLLADTTLYKTGGMGDDEALTELLLRSVSLYAQTAKDMPLLDETQKAEKNRLIAEYSTGLVTKGGISTDVFKSALGVDTTLDFFAKVFFGTER